MRSCGSAEVWAELYERCSVRHFSMSNTVFGYFLFHQWSLSEDQFSLTSRPRLVAGQLPDVKEDQACKALQHANLITFESRWKVRYLKLGT